MATSLLVPVVQLVRQNMTQNVLAYRTWFQILTHFRHLHVLYSQKSGIYHVITCTSLIPIYRTVCARKLGMSLGMRLDSYYKYTPV